MFDADTQSSEQSALPSVSGTTWRKLSNAERDGVNEEAAKGLMRDQPALIKRPVFQTKTGIIVGFKQTEVEAIKASI